MRKEGNLAEHWAQAYLERAGLFVVMNNFSVRGGELDIIARDAVGLYIFVEVKLRATEPEDHSSLLPFAKRRRLGHAMRMYMMRNGISDGRFDLLVLVGNAARVRRVIWYKNVSLI